MPRGIRAVHGQEVTGGVHGRGNTHSDLIAYIPDVDFLQVTCWCEQAVVAVTQRDVRDEGITYSCGQPTCRPPIGTTFQVALVQWRGATSLERVHPGIVRHASGRKATAPMFPQGSRSRTHVRSRPRRPRATTEEVAARRDGIAALYRQGFSPKLIAERLGLHYYDVANSLVAMRKQGRL